MLQQSQECVMVVYLERRSEKKLKWREKKPHSQQCWDSAKKASSSSCVSPCPGEGKSIEAKFWLYREESPATDTVFSQVPWSQTDIAVALFITSYNRQTTLTLLQWAQKQAKKKKLKKPISFIPYIYTVSLKRGKSPPVWLHKGPKALFHTWHHSSVKSPLQHPSASNQHTYLSF